MRFFHYALIGFVLLGSINCARPKYLLDPTSNNPPQGSGNPEKSFDEACPNRLQSDPEVCFIWWWATEPTPREPGNFYVRFYRLNNIDQSPVPLATANTPRVLLWMPSMDHGSIPVVVSEEDIGTFKVDRVWFSMPGDWEIRFEIPFVDRPPGSHAIKLWI